MKMMSVGAVIALLSLHAELSLAKPTNDQLTIGMTQEFESLNPIILNMSASNYTYYMVGRPLMVIDGEWAWQCELCTEVPSLENGRARLIEEDGKQKVVVDWQLKEGLQWGDGKPLTAADVRLGWEMAINNNVSVPSKETYDRVETFTIDAKDPLKFTTKFKEARYDFYQWAVTPIPSHLEAAVWATTKDQAGAYEKQTTYSTDPTNPGLYSGPYVITELKLGSHIVLEKSKHWAGPKASIKKIIVKLIPNTQTLEAALLSGTIDMISELGMTFDQAVAFDKRMARDASKKGLFEVHFRDGLVYEHIDFNLRNPILQDKNVRKALMLSADREKLSQALFEGKQKRALSNVHPLDPYYTDQVVDYPYDPKKAAELLDGAGWKLAKDGFRYKDGQKLDFVIMTTTDNKTRELVEVFLQQEWKKMGISLTIKNEPARVFFGETVRKGAYPAMAMYAWTSSPDNPPRTTLHSEEIPTEANGWSGQNSGGWSTKEMDKLLEDIFREFDFEKRKEIMARIQYLYTDELPVMPLYLRAQISVIPGNMTGFALTGHQYYSTLGVENWTFETRVAKATE